MSRQPRLMAILVAAIFAVGVASAATSALAQDDCAACHLSRSEAPLRAPVFDQAASIHGAADMSCADCHGGVREETTVRAHNPDRGFIARPAPEEVPGICGGCHSDPVRLGEFATELPTDQLELYRRSGHGRALARGNGGAATCVSCHGTHSVQPPTDPRSLVYPDNIATTCGGCHSDPNAMTNSGMPLNQVVRWRRSVHGRAFVDDDNDEAPTCNGCHDAHGGITGLDDVAACGRCHEEQEESFLESPHAEVFERLGFASCVDCHGSHDVREAHANLVGVTQGSTCLRCHTREQPMVFETIRRLGNLRAAAEVASRSGRQALERLDPQVRSSEQVLELEGELNRASDDLNRGIHSFNDTEVEGAVRLMTETAASLVALQRENSPDAIGGSNLLMVALSLLVLIVTVVAGYLFRRKT